MVGRRAAPPAPLYVAESPAAYDRRPRVVVDASVVAAAIFGEAGWHEATMLLRGRILAAPHVVDCEIASIALKKRRRERMPAHEVAESLDDYETLAIERHAVEPAAVFAIAQQHGLTAYDAAYLWLAERLEAPLATFDATLARAARNHLEGDTGTHDAG